jgi:NADH:ubiquinone oxidoreductase 49 kD subunit 7
MAKEKKTLNLNFGPQHPAAHGSFKINTSLKWEKFVKKPILIIGLLHRGY